MHGHLEGSTAGGYKGRGGIVTRMSTVVDLRTAIADHVEPGDTLHFRGGYGFSFAAVHELLRQFRGASLSPAERFALVAIGATVWSGPLVHEVMIDRLVVSFAGLGYPSPAPHPILRDRIADGSLEIEDWTYLTLIQRLRAGALGHPFVPTNSLEDSSIGPSEETAAIESPFDDEAGLVVSPLEPDVSFVHGIVADRDGNTVVSPILSEDHWGAYASETVVATVERVVDDDVVRAYNHETALPGYAVDAVVEAPFGAHPGPLYNPLGIGDVPSYDYDREFYLALREANRSPEALDAWVEEWVTDTDWSGYVERVDADRRPSVGDTSPPSGGQRDAPDANADVTAVGVDPPTERERMIVWAAEELAARVAAGGHEVVFGGIGVSHVASWLYRERCAREGAEARPLLVESGVYDFDPPRDDAYIFTPRALPSAKLVDSSTFGLGLVMSTARNLSVLTGAQIDKHGNVNSGRIGGTHFVGSGGANDALSNSDEVVLVVEASPRRLVEEVEYVTGPGTDVTTVVTQFGTLRKHGEELRIGAVHVPPGETRESRLEAFEDAVGWDVARAANVDERGWGSEEDELVDVLRSMDVAGDYRG